MAKPTAPAELTALFKWLLLIDLVLTVLSLAVGVFLVLRFPKDAPDDVKQVVESCMTTWKFGFGAFIGLIGGKAT